MNIRTALKTELNEYRAAKESLTLIIELNEYRAAKEYRVER